MGKWNTATGNILQYANTLIRYIEKYNRFNHSREFDKEEEISLKEQLNAISAYLLEIEKDTLNEKYKIIEPDKNKYTKELKDKLIKLIGYKHPDFQKLDMFFSNLVLTPIFVPFITTFAKGNG